MKGLFITLEGPDGSGKSTIAPLLYEKLKNEGIDVILTREPGGVKIAEAIRNVILDKDNTEMDAKTEALLYAAARRQHLIEKIIPNVDSGKLVLCERYVDSSLAYQGFGRAIGFNEVLSINEFAIEEHFPDLTIYFDIDEKLGLERISKNRTEKDRLDDESLEFHHLTHEGYKVVLEKFKDRIVLVDASLSIDEVLKASLNIIKEFMWSKRN